MKNKTLKLSLVVLFVGIVLGGCKKNNPTPTSTPSGGGGNASTNTFSYKLNGNAITIASIQAQKVSGANVISIKGVSAAASLDFVINDTVTVGTHSLDSWGWDDSYLTFLTTGTAGVAGSQYSSEDSPDLPCKLSITEHNTTTNKISGTFYASCEEALTVADTIAITEGSFSVVYTE